MDRYNYIMDRLLNNKDDRQDRRKLDSDAKLRGTIGEKEADRIIEFINNEKMRR